MKCPSVSLSVSYLTAGGLGQAAVVHRAAASTQKTGSSWLLGWLNRFSAQLSPKRYSGDRDPRGWGKWETVPNTTLSSTPE